MRALAALLGLLVTGCVPAYIPSAVNTPLLEEKGDVHGSVRVGSEGLQLDGAYAVNDDYAVLLSTHGTGSAEGYESYEVLKLGVSRYWADGAGAGESGAVPADADASGPDETSAERSDAPADQQPADDEADEVGFRPGERSAVSVELGTGRWRWNREEETVGGGMQRIGYEGELLLASVQTMLAYEWRYLAAGAVLRGTFIRTRYRPVDGGQHRVVHRLAGEPAVFVRAGTRPVKFELMIGTATAFGPARVVELEDSEMPAILSLGLVGDF